MLSIEKDTTRKQVFDYKNPRFDFQDHFLEVVDISPELAEFMLESNIKNRVLGENLLLKFSRILSSGRWSPTASQIKFDWDGLLIDGQHRLGAIMHSGVTAKMGVIFGCDPNDFKVIDSGKSRTASDVLSIAGLRHYTTTASIINLVWSYENSLRYHTPSPYRLSNEDVLRIANSDERFSEAAAIARSCDDLRKLMPPSLIGLIHYCGNQADKDLTNRFFAYLQGEIPITNKNPTFLLRDRLHQDGKSSLKNKYRIALSIKAWNLLGEDRSVKFLKIQDSSKNGKEPYPKFRGYENQISDGNWNLTIER